MMFTFTWTICQRMDGVLSPTTSSSSPSAKLGVRTRGTAALLMDPVTGPRRQHLSMGAKHPAYCILRGNWPPTPHLEQHTIDCPCDQLDAD